MTTRGRNPCHANALTWSNDFPDTVRQDRCSRYRATKVVTTFFHYSDNLMSQNDWQLGRGSPPFDFVQFRVAHSAACHAQQDLASTNFGLRCVCKRKGSFILFERCDLS